MRRNPDTSPALMRQFVHRVVRGPAPVLAFAVASPAVAQDAPAARSPRVTLGAGLDGFLRDGDTPTPQLALHAGYELRAHRGPASHRTGLRLGLDLTTQRFGTTVLRANGVPFDTLDRSGRTTAAGVVLLGTYAFGGGRLRPYALGGGGVYYAHTERRVPAVAPVEGLTEGSPGFVQRGSRVSPAVSAGFGLSYALGRAALFGEARGTLLTGGVGGVPRTGRALYLPLVAGVRF